MKQTRLISLIFGFLATTLFVVGPDGANAAAPGYSNASLDGVYLVMKTEVYQEDSVTMYCEDTGTMSFDGIGTVRGNVTGRCTDGVTATIATNTVIMNYSVNADGSFFMTEPDETHGPFKIVQDGKAFMTDYSTATTIHPAPSKLLWHLVAFKEGKN
ncbi:MAG TPA: hypothetical protein DCO77_03640 [Nitrospiraceae bacterium]|nr:hypothetical protein [Nitrospiraceae bacterium]